MNSNFGKGSVDVEVMEPLTATQIPKDGQNTEILHKFVAKDTPSPPKTPKTMCHPQILKRDITSPKHDGSTQS